MNTTQRFFVAAAGAFLGLLAVPAFGQASGESPAAGSPPTAPGTPAPASTTPAPSAPGTPTPSKAETPMSTTPSTSTPVPATAATEVKTQKATFGAGCFWGVEEFFRTTKGVTATRVGYAGGEKDKPTYKEVCTDETGHAEVVEVTFDPSVITYEKLVSLFFKIHDPTQVNRQGPDYGSQYRTVIFYHSPEQKAAAEAEIKRLTDSGRYKKPIATKVQPAPTFWAAEDYHQQYFFKRGIPNTCHVLEE